MKSKISILFSLLMYCHLHAQPFSNPIGQTHAWPENKLSVQYESDLLDSIVTWAWNVDHLTWELSSKTAYQYDEDHYITVYLASSWTGTEWQYSGQQLFTYDDHHNILHQLSKSWDGFLWQNSSQHNYLYDENDNPLSDAYQIWTGTDWNNYFQTLNVYNDAAEHISELNQLWDGSTWTNESKDTFAYQNHQLQSTIISSYDEAEGWIYFQQYLYQYQGEKTTEYLIQNWNETDWMDQTRYQYTYDENGNNTVYLIQRFLTGAWTNFYQFLFEHTSFNEVFTEHQDFWKNDAWENYYDSATQFDDRENIKSKSGRIWDSEWVNSDSSTYYYSLASSLDQPTDRGQSCTIFPNPAARQIFIHTDAMLMEPVPYRIYTIDGRILKSSTLYPLPYQSIDVSPYDAGSYILQAWIDDQWQMKVFIKQ